MMQKKNRDAIRAKYRQFFLDVATAAGEDCGFTATGEFNFPVTSDDGEEGWVRVIIQIPTKMEGDDGYTERLGYEVELKEAAEKAEANVKKKATKIKKDEALRAEKAAKKAKILAKLEENE